MGKDYYRNKHALEKRTFFVGKKKKTFVFSFAVMALKTFN